MKYNTNGASKGNHGECACGFCVRIWEGDVLYAKANNIGIVTNMEAESLEITKGMLYCLNNKFCQVRLKSVSLSLSKMIRKEWRVPGNLTYRIEEIQITVWRMSVHVNHIFREANQLKNYIANTTINSKVKQQFHNFMDLPNKGRKLVNTDK